MPLKMLRALLLMGLIGGLTACANKQDSFVQTLQFLVKSEATSVSSALNPFFRYLRLTLDGRVIYLALGDEEGADDARTEVWYSADRGVLRLRDGRVAGAMGTTTEWRRVTLFDAPSWSDVSRTSGVPLRWQRVRDVMPGYQVGVRDTLSLRRIPPPKESALVNVASDSLVWFEETVAGDVLPPARYAIDPSGARAIVVYGEQCLSMKLCLSWQRWTATPPAK